MARLLERGPAFILTLDISSNSVGYALYDNKCKELECSGSLRSTRKDYSRLFDIADQFTAMLAGYPLFKFYEVLVEQPFYSPGKSNDLPIKMMHGILMDRMHCRVNHPKALFSWNYVSVQTWRNPIAPPPAIAKDESGKRRKKTAKEKDLDRLYVKQRVMLVTQDYFGVKVGDDDQGDALGILHWRLNYGR